MGASLGRYHAHHSRLVRAETSSPPHAVPMILEVPGNIVTCWS